MSSGIPILNAHQSLPGRGGSLMASPVIIALLLIRMVLHGLIAWIIWQAGERLWGAVAQVYGGLLPALLLSLLAFIFAWRALRRLPQEISVTPQGIHLPDGRFVSGAEIFVLSPVMPKAMLWHLLWPAMPWRLLTLPCSLRGWWRMEMADGIFFFSSGDVEAIKQLAATRQLPSQESGADSGARQQTVLPIPNEFQPFRLLSPWPFDVVMCLIVLVEQSWLLLLFVYGVGRIGWIARQHRRKLLWRRVAVRPDVAMHAGVRDSVVVDPEVLDTYRPASGALSIMASPRSEATPAARMSRILWRFALLPLNLLPVFDRHHFSAAQWFASMGHRFFSALAWLLLKVPLLLMRQAKRIPGLISRLATRLLRWLVLVVLHMPTKVGRALMLVFSLWQTALLTLVGWAVAVLLSYPLTVLVANPQAALWHEVWMVRGVLWRASGDESVRQASAMLDKARAAGDTAAVHAVLQGAAVDGVFHLVGWQPERRQTMACRDAVPPMAGVRLQLDEPMDAPALLREVACNPSPGHLQSELLADAYRRSGGQLDIHVAVSSGDPALLPLVLEKDVLETRDWQGRTPLLLALDLAAAGGERRPGWLSIAQSLQQRGADVSAIDLAGRSAVYLAVQSGLSGEALKPYLLAATAPSTSALGATLVHAAAASGEVATFYEVLQSNWRLDLTSRTRDGRNALHFARGAAMVQALFQQGLDPDLRDARGRLPLHTAILSGDSSAALALAHITLAPQTMDNFGRTPLDYAPAIGHNTVHNTARKTGSNKPLTDAERPWNELAREIAERTRK